MNREEAPRRSNRLFFKPKIASSSPPLLDFFLRSNLSIVLRQSLEFKDIHDACYTEHEEYSQNPNNHALNGLKDKYFSLFGNYQRVANLPLTVLASKQFNGFHAPLAISGAAAADILYEAELE